MPQQNITLNMFLPIKQKGLKPEDYIPRQTVIPAQCFGTQGSSDQSYQPLTMLLAVKIGSELTQFTPKKKLDNTTHQHKGLYFSKSRLSDFQDVKETRSTKKGTLAQLLIKKGIVKHSLVIPEFSPLTW